MSKSFNFFDLFVIKMGKKYKRICYNILSEFWNRINYSKEVRALTMGTVFNFLITTLIASDYLKFCVASIM